MHKNVENYMEPRVQNVKSKQDNLKVCLKNPFSPQIDKKSQKGLKNAENS